MKKAAAMLDTVAGAKPRTRRPMRVAAIGLRGIPGIQGGIETHAQALYPLLAQSGMEVTVHTRAPFVDSGSPSRWQGVSLVRSWSPKASGVEALAHTVLALLKARWQGADVVHIHGIGPALVTPLARLLRLPVLVTHHGRDYEREKWGWFAKQVLRWGEVFAARFANRVICVARNDADRLNRRFGTGTAVAIPNGAPLMPDPDGSAVLEALGLERGRYVLNVARLVPEKRQLDLIAAFERCRRPGWKLVLVGSALDSSAYPTALSARASQVPDCVLAGERKGGDLAALYANAGVYMLPSSHEGLPISLMEAISFGLPCLVSDIPANREFELAGERYFPVGDVDRTATLMAREMALLSATEPAEQSRQQFDRLPRAYRWESVASATATLLEQLDERRR